jgi:hypothetical protein
MSELSKTNLWRACKGQAAYIAHRGFTLEETKDPLDECDLIDLLTDIRHLANRDDVDFDEALRLSLELFNDEVEGCDDFMDIEEGKK